MSINNFKKYIELNNLMSNKSLDTFLDLNSTKVTIIYILKTDIFTC